RIELSGQVQCRPIRMVKHVVGFNAKLDDAVAFAVLDLFEQRHVPVVQTRSANCVDTRVIADAALRCGSETAGVDVLADGPVSTALVRVASQNDTRRKIFATSNQPVHTGAVGGGEGVSGRL